MKNIFKMLMGIVYLINNKIIKLKDFLEHPLLRLLNLLVHILVITIHIHQIMEHLSHP